MNFDARLESLRGTAALAVLITHTTAAFRVDGHAAFWAIPLSEHSLQTWPLIVLQSLFNAGSAVVLFFVLSGYVLTLSLRRAREPGWLGAYSIRRAFRLLPPMWASIFVMLVIVSATTGDAFSSWFAHVFQEAGPSAALANVALWSYAGNPVTWTMYVEVIGSALVPASLYLSDRFGARAGWALLLICSLLTLSYQSLTLTYLVSFQAGILLATSRTPRIEKSIARALFFLGVAVFVLEGRFTGLGGFSVLINTAGSAAIIFGVLNNAASGFLSSAPLRALGRVSYSLYLFHLPVIYLTGIWLATLIEPGLLATAYLIAIAVPASIALAAVGYAVFERPSIALGRWGASWWRSITRLARADPPSRAY